MLKAYSQFPVDVFNVSSHDLWYFAGLLAKVGLSQAKTEPQFRRLVSANIVDEKRGSPVLRPFIVREVPSRQKGEKPIRVAFIGLTETTPAPPTGLKFIDPAEAARRTLPGARTVADIVVVLAKISSQIEVARIAREAPGIDIILDGNAESLESGFTPPLYVGSTLIVFTPYETRMIGELRFYRNAQGKFTTRQRFVALDEILVPEDPEAKRVVQAGAAAESETRDHSKKLLEDWLTASRIRVTTRPTDPDSLGNAATPTLLSSAACSQCHVAQYMKWANSAHAQATNSLPVRVLEFEAGCLDCHATGANRPNGINVDPARLPNVQCEQCHGPGSNHVKNPGKGYGPVDMKSACIACHTSEISPGFDLQAAWTKIKH